MLAQYLVKRVREEWDSQAVLVGRVSRMGGEELGFVLQGLSDRDILIDLLL